MPGIPIGSAATRWINPENGEPLLLFFNEALFFGQKMQNTLLCPNQVRSNGVEVNGLHEATRTHHDLASSLHALTLHGRISTVRVRTIATLFQMLFELLH
jgi:hypothetical protein